MGTSILLKGIGGPLRDTEHIYSNRTTCILGRADGCNPRIPDTKRHGFISRHHCLLDINPPAIRLRDLGSLNGTYVNGEKIGQRTQEDLLSTAGRDDFPEHDLKNGDKIQIGDSVFQVHIHLPMVCASCSKEVKKKESDATKSSFILCRKCTELGRKPHANAGTDGLSRHCASCHEITDDDATRNGQGDVLCRSCRNEPLNIIQNAHAEKSGGVEDSIGAYDIKSKIGIGGMGVVYLGMHRTKQQQVALKVMLPEIAADESSVGRFLREISNTKVLNHGNVVKLLDSGYSNGAFFLCLEYCRGGSLYELMQARDGQLSIDDSLKVVFQVLKALDYAHSLDIPNVQTEEDGVASGRGLVHRDIKPKNILLDKADSVESVKVADFGLSKAFDMAGLSGLTFTGDIGGSPLFMCRQQVINFKYAKAEVDVWSAAATLYKMLTGAYPRDFSASKDPWSVVLDSQPVPIGQRTKSIPKPLASVIDHALRDDPKIGFQSARKFSKALMDAL